jgi:ribosomal protein S18 acetylase RimI-like enzyme
MGTIRRATTSDQQHLGELAAEVFALYGSEYGLMIPAYGRDIRVITLLYEDDNRLVGFIQVGFLEAPGSRRDLIADILAVAVAPGYQARGYGTALFQRVLELLRPMRERGTVTDVQLTVADTNSRATRLFRRLGFAILEQKYGTYEGGQQAIRMSLGRIPGATDPR